MTGTLKQLRNYNMYVSNLFLFLLLLEFISSFTTEKSQDFKNMKYKYV